MILILISLFVVGPIAEIFVLLQAGSAFGAGPVILACIATAVVGGAILRWQGLAAIEKARGSMQGGQVPVEAVVDAVFLAIAAPFLMTPGFLTDMAGFLFLVPPFRHFAARRALAALKRRIDNGDNIVVIKRS